MCVAVAAVVLVASYCVLLLCVIRPHTGTISMYSATDMVVVTGKEKPVRM